jgi:hypothetical protein
MFSKQKNLFISLILALVCTLRVRKEHFFLFID